MKSRTIWILIFLNTLVFLFWVLSSGFMPELFNFMAYNFLVSWTALEEGRFWVLLTSVFSHMSFFHFLINMYVLRGFGPIVHQVLGTKSFIRFYLVAGVFSSFVHAQVSLLFLGDPSLPALGASGALAGVILLFSLIFPQEKLFFFGFIPMKAKWASLLIVGIDVWGLVEQSRGGGLPIGHGAHLGGAFVGLCYYFLFLRRRFLE